MLSGKEVNSKISSRYGPAFATAALDKPGFAVIWNLFDRTVWNRLLGTDNNIVVILFVDIMDVMVESFTPVAEVVKKSDIVD